MKKMLLALLAVMASLSALVGCAGQDFDPQGNITVISREDGSGTRGAFIELFGVEQKNELNEKVDYTVETSVITNSTSVMMTSVLNNPQAIGYISLGSYNESVKALKIDGVEATVENIKNGTYKISRPFNIATKAGLSEVASDFINFILSEEGQAVIEANGYISAVEGQPYSGIKPTGKIVVGGSSSVTPVMEKLKEAYLKINFNATIEIQLSDSTTGMTGAADGIFDIGMSSRALKTSELDKGLVPTIIAMDGIAVIVNSKNTFDSLTTAQVKEIYVGNFVNWKEITE